MSPLDHFQYRLSWTDSVACVYEHRHSKILIHFRHRSCGAALRRYRRTLFQKDMELRGEFCLENLPAKSLPLGHIGKPFPWGSECAKNHTENEVFTDCWGPNNRGSRWRNRGNLWAFDFGSRNPTFCAFFHHALCAHVRRARPHRSRCNYFTIFLSCRSTFKLLPEWPYKYNLYIHGYE